MKILKTLVLLLCTQFCVAQYYYNDIISTANANKNYALLKKLQVKKVVATAFNANQEPIENFSLAKQMNYTQETIVSNTKIISENEVQTTATYSNNKLAKTIEDGKKINLVVEFEYNAAGNIIAVTTNTADTSVNYDLYETHLYLYNKKGQPIQMLKIKNDTDTTLVNFVLDEQGNVGEERWIKNGRVVEQYYYYYDAKNQLTDLVRFNQKAQRPLPIEIFEYNDLGQVIKNTRIPYGNSNYTIWLYKYLANGLVEKEYQYNKTNEFLGKMEYVYTF